MSDIILYGGAFDPVHNGHIRIAKAAAKAFKSDVFFIPNKTPPWKQAKASAKDRLEMLRLAIASSHCRKLKLSLFEIKSKSEINYSIDTVRHFAELYPKKRIHLLIGADEANLFDKWKQCDEIASLCQIIVVSRPDYPLDEAMMSRFHMKRLMFDKSGDVSSSGVRKLLSYDIADAVRDYIEDKGLYYMADLKKKLSKKRLAHCLEVARLSYRIAVKSRVESPGRLYAAGLLHDIAKELSNEVSKMLMAKEYPERITMPEWTYHQFLGALIAKKEFGIDNQAILSAIACHATGKGDMSVEEKILYSADKIEPTRGYDSRGYIKACLKDIDEGFRIVLQANREFYHQQGYQFTDNPLTEAAVLQYLGE